MVVLINTWNKLQHNMTAAEEGCVVHWGFVPEVWVMVAWKKKKASMAAIHEKAHAGQACSYTNNALLQSSVGNKSRTRV